ncbi:siderophore-interacting protein [Pseudooceanicola sp. MF1-13]|uniref:siderophore-interacting protein n=1 Tax=Pseudooceanicola sp. MF1-13 TaxID=3379095 RepID=UPI0038927BB3
MSPTPSDRAAFDQPYNDVLPAFRTAVTSKGMKLAEHDDHAEVTLSRGTIRLDADGSRSSVTLFEVDAIGGQVLRDLLDTMAADMGMTLQWAVQRDRGLPANLSLTTVETSEQISPSFHRLVVRGTDLSRFASGGLHFTLPQGPEGAGWPYTDEGGVTRWPEGIAAWHRPVFTTRSLEQVGDDWRLTFDVFLHDGGRTPGWASGLGAGDEVAIMGPSGSAMPKPAGYLAIIADETAVPVAARILADWPIDAEGQVILFVQDHKDVQDLTAPPGITIDWVLRGSDETPVDAVNRLNLPDSDRYVLFAAEKSEAAAAKEALTAKGLVRGEFLAASYWSAS